MSTLAMADALERSGRDDLDKESARKELDERRLQVVAEQAVGLRWEILLTAVTVFAVCWRDVPWQWLATWFVAVIATRELRAAALTRMVRQPSEAIAGRLRRTVHWNFWLGAANGSAAFFMWNLDPTLDAVLTMILVSWGAGAVSTSATVFPAFLSYAAWLFLPTALMWAITGTWLGTGVSVLVVMFFGVQIRFARRNLRTFEESFRIRLENVELARQLAVEGQEVALARDAAVRAGLSKSQFLASASHDLRQPLQAMALNMGELSRIQTHPEALDIARDVRASIDDLRSMLDGLLDVSKLDAGGVRAVLRAVQLDRLIDGVCQSFRPLAEARGLALEWVCPVGLIVHTDAELLRRILANLVDNALKFTDKGSVRVTVQAEVDHAIVEVIDTGPGIAPESQLRVFDDLVQLGNLERNRVHGHGLGLGIVRRLASLLDLPLRLESEPGQGSCFRLSLVRSASPVSGHADAATPQRLDGCRILVLDDDRRVRQACHRVLAGLHAQVEVAGDLEGALQILRRWRADVAVVDFRLAPDLNGIDAIQRLRDQQPGLTALLLSADADHEVARIASEAGVSVLLKPVCDASLAEAVRASSPDRARASTPSIPQGSR